MGDLLKFPVEIIQLVADQTTTQDLGSLRLTCKVIEKILFDRFATEFFAVRQICLHPISVQNLVDISNHPEFSKAIRKLIVCDESIESRVNPLTEEVQTHICELRNSRYGAGYDSITSVRVQRKH